VEFERGRLDRIQDAEASWNAATCKTEGIEARTDIKEICC
jgi:hypothetical protein